MRSENYPLSQTSQAQKTGDLDEPSVRTFIEDARRTQLVDAAITVLADIGYERASLARIAAVAGVSKGVVSYHFTSKEELLSEVVGRVSGEGEAFMLPRILAQTTAIGRLQAYIRANVEFMAARRDGLAALIEVLVHTPAPNPYVAIHRAGLAQLEEMLAGGQAAGELGSFSPAVLAMAIRAAIDGIPAWLASEPGLDLPAVGERLAELFGRAVLPS